MTLLDDARGLSGWSTLYYDGISRKVRNGVTGWERWRCVFCHAETLKHYHTEAQHDDDCRWQTTLPRLVAVAEAAELARHDFHFLDLPAFREDRLAVLALADRVRATLHSEEGNPA